jgi:hypothetical protein
MYYGNRTRLNIVRSWNIQPGDFVNMVSWFGDVWAEVKKVVGTWIVLYRHDGKYKTDMVYIGNVRKLCRKENIDKIATCRLITASGIIPATFPMNPDARTFVGDKNIYVKDSEDIH